MTTDLHHGIRANRAQFLHQLLQVLLVGLPVPLMVWHAPDWNWIVAATVLLGVNQGLAWSMT